MNFKCFFGIIKKQHDHIITTYLFDKLIRVTIQQTNFFEFVINFISSKHVKSVWVLMRHK